MKKICILFSFVVAFTVPRQAAAQVEELQQLILDLEKLAQFKQILSDLKKGYDILFNGYSTVKNIAEGNFNLHKVFLDGLLEVSPAVRNYKRVGDIISYQLQLVKEYKTAFKRFQGSDLLTTDELEYIGAVYANLVKQSLQNLDALAMVITAGKARMSDDERLRVIDDLFRDIEDKLTFLRWFNNTGTVLLLQRAKEKNDVSVSKELYGLP